MLFARAAAFGLRRAYSTAPGLTFMERIKDKFNWTVREKPLTLQSAAHIYVATVDKVDMNLWFKHFEMPDTFLSWFFVTELHVWMALTRVMAGNNQRRSLVLRDAMITNLWQDSDERIKKLGGVPSSIKRKCMQELSEHFNAALCIYDEGLSKDDQALANALWRVFFIFDADFRKFQELRTLVHYVRRNVAYLDDLPFEKFTEENRLEWRPLQESVKATVISTV